jgi:hypothetical protein
MANKIHLVLLRREMGSAVTISYFCAIIIYVSTVSAHYVPHRTPMEALYHPTGFDTQFGSLKTLRPVSRDVGSPALLRAAEARLMSIRSLPGTPFVNIC